MDEDAKKPYGDVEYADPGYQEDKKKRYPIDTEEHARAAWSYINKEKNASQYSSSDLAKVRARIKRACKKFKIEIEEGDEDGEKARAGGDASDEDAILCRTAIELSGDIADNEFTFLPAGLHSITPAGGGIGRPINVLIDEASAATIEEQRHKLMAKGKRPYFDFNHEDGASSFWPAHFFWRARDGVVCRGLWSDSGRKAVSGHDFRAFSPVFYVDNKRGTPARVVARENAKPNMGGLVNDPAFSNLPLWAKNDGQTTVTAGAFTTSVTRGEHVMTTEEIAALRAKNQELEQKIDELQALVEANQEDATTQAELKAARAEHTANGAKMRLAEQEALIARQAEEIRASREHKVDTEIRAAIARGAILPRDTESQRSLKAAAMADEAFLKTIRSFPARITAGRIVEDSSRYEVRTEDPQRILCKMAEIAGRQVRANPREKTMLAQEFYAIYAREVSPLHAQNSARIFGYPLTSVNDALMAADNVDANLGTLSGTLVAQRTLELLKFIFPELVSFTADFSDQPAQFGQTIMTRIINIPTVQTYSTTSGWTDSVAATTDVPVTINNHKGVPITFNENILASTVRRLFDEFAEASAYALGKSLVDALYANITDANFANNTISTAATFTRAIAVQMENALTKRGVPFSNRTLLLWPDAFASLETDSTLVTLASYRVPEIITVGTTAQSKFVIPVASFQVVNAPNLPSNNANLNGFAGSKSALVIATRVPNDYTSILPGASFGNVAMVTDPDIGMTVMQAQYVNHILGTATSRLSLMFGTAAGQSNAGQLLKAAAGSGSSH